MQDQHLNEETIEIKQHYVCAKKQLLQRHHRRWSGTRHCRLLNGVTWNNPPYPEIGTTPIPWVMAL
jgi:hypothetical protein